MRSEVHRPVKEAMAAQEAAPDPAAIVQAHMATAARTAEALDRLEAAQERQPAAREEGKGIAGALYKVLKPPGLETRESRAGACDADGI